VGELVYIGSTTQPRLSLRLGQHKTNYNQWVKNGKKYMSSFELFKLGTPKIELIESFLCGSKDELRMREGYHQRATDCVNKNIAGQTPEEYREANQEKISKRDKQYYEANQQKITERAKQYYEANQEKITEQKKQYRDANKEKISKQAKQYYDANQEKISKRVKQYYEANQEKISKRDKQYYEANQEKISKRKKQYYEANQEKISEYYRMRYANNKRIERLTLFILSHIRKVNSI
jgi:exonuclease VII large subunit